MDHFYILVTKGGSRWRMVFALFMKEMAAQTGAAASLSLQSCLLSPPPPRGITLAKICGWNQHLKMMFQKLWGNEAFSRNKPCFRSDPSHVSFPDWRTQTCQYYLKLFSKEMFVRNTTKHPVLCYAITQSVWTNERNVCGGKLPLVIAGPT